MLISIWGLLAFFFLPLGILIAFLLLSGFLPLIWLGLRFCKIQVQLGILVLRLPSLIAIFSCFCVLMESNSLWRVTHLRNDLLLSPVPNEYAWKANLWRHQRNWFVPNFF
jgi:ABC-type tungstate transport system substrate-binding protein